MHYSTNREAVASKNEPFVSRRLKRLQRLQKRNIGFYYTSDFYRFEMASEDYAGFIEHLAEEAAAETANYGETA